MTPGDNLRAGARRAFLDLLRAERPDLSHEVVLDPVERLERHPTESVVVERVPGLDDTDTLDTGPAAAPHPHGGKAAA